MKRTHTLFAAALLAALPSAGMADGVNRVYVGEYACNGEVGSGNMLAALSEAAFMFGMERNSDLVKMASYAPLLVNVNRPNWSCSLIWFDSYRAMGRASYYLQKLMAENRPDYNVGVSMTQTQPDTTQTPYPLQFFVAGYDEARGEAVVKVVNADTKPYKMRLAVDGAERVAAKGRVITLKAARAEDENTLDEPQKIVPVEKAYGKFGRKFAYTFEPLSVTVLRIPATLKP